MAKIVERHKQLKLTQDIENLNSSIISKEIKSVTKKLPTKKKAQAQIVSLVNSTKH